MSLGFFSKLTPLTPELISGRGQYWGGVLAERVSSRGLTVTDIFGSGATATEMALNHPASSERERSAQLFRDLVEIAIAVGSAGLTLLPGVHHKAHSKQDALRLSAEELRWRVDEAQHRGLRLSIEPHAHSHVDTPEKVLELLELVPGLELTLDYGHFHIQDIPDIYVDPLLPYTRHFHCRGAKSKTIQTSFTTNTIDFLRILEAMNACGYDGWIEIEYIRWAPSIGGEDCDNLREARRYLDFFVDANSALSRL